MPRIVIRDLENVKDMNNGEMAGVRGGAMRRWSNIRRTAAFGNRLGNRTRILPLSTGRASWSRRPGG